MCAALLLMNVRKNSIILFSYAIIPFIDEASRLARAYPATEAADIAHLTFSSPEKTLESAEISAIIDSIVKEVIDAFGAELV